MKLQYQLGGTGKGTGFPVGGNRAYFVKSVRLVFTAQISQTAKDLRRSFAEGSIIYFHVYCRYLLYKFMIISIVVSVNVLQIFKSID